MNHEPEPEPGDPTPPRRPRFRRRPSGADPGVETPTLGYIPATPATPAPTLADPGGDAANAYRQAVDRIRAATTSRILLVSSPDGGSRPSQAALNLAIAATRLGMRIVVIDGDADGEGPSQYLRTAEGPGLAALAAGRADLRQASRLMKIDADNRFPIIPTGTFEEGESFDAAALADPVDRLSEHSDLVLIVTGAEGAWVEPLAVHADGALLVVGGDEAPDVLAAGHERLASLGAPVVGLVELARPRRGNRRRARGRP